MQGNFKRNLLLGFSASLLILMISSVASFMSIRNLLESANLVNHTNEVIIELTGITSGLVDAETGQRGFLLVGEEEFLQPYTTARERTITAFGKAQALTVDNPRQQRSLEQLRSFIDERFRWLDTSIVNRRLGRPINAANLRNGREVMVQIRDLIEQMKEHENMLMIERTENMRTFASYTPMLIIVAALAAFIITILFYIRVRNDFEERSRLQLQLEEKDRDITRRIDIIRGIADKVAQGSYDIRIDEVESDSLGNVAVSLNKMARSLQYSFGQLSDKEWLQTGLSKLNEVMIGEKSQEDLSQDVISLMATYTHSNVGALYILANDELTAFGAYAFMPDQLRRRVKLNEGLIGQAAATGKPIDLRGVSQDSIQVSFVAGEARPRDVVAFPIYDGYQVKGAFEVATIGSYTQREMEFLEACSRNIGIAISTAQNRRKLQELLEETQSQSEELKMQHGELENLNGELEVQAEKLQASEEELKVQQEELKQANEELEERSRLLEEKNQVITERNYDIQTKAEQLAQSAKYKSEFLANMSHELRTPLNSILLLSRLMTENQEKNLTEDQTEYARVIQASGLGLLSLIDEILDLSKIEAGKMQLDYQAVTVSEIVADINSMFQPVAREKNIDFPTSIGKDVPPALETDKLRLEQVLRNLLSNAIKFTSRGHVKLSVERDKKQKDNLLFVVEDTGIGIPQDKLAIIFEAFQQADGSTRRKYGGTGLGLSISRELVRLLGGEISVESEEGKGSRFILSVPITRESASRPKPGPEVKAPAPPPVIEIEPAADPKFISKDIPENVPDDRRSVQQGENVILIVEDDINFAKSLLEFTRKRGYKGIVAVRGDEGIELARKYMPLGILLDIQLPVKSGWQVMEELKGDPATRHIPVHIMSSFHVKSESLLKGAVDFINKPMAFEQMPEIFKKIEYVLTHHPKKVLIVEDNTRHAKALAYFLGTFDINLQINHDVEAAVQSLKDKDVDCVILDMGIPDQKAYDTLEAVKKTPGLENLPIIIFTGKSLSQQEQLKIKQYADSIVVKTAHSYKRVLDEVSLFLHLMEKNGKENGHKSRRLGPLDEVLEGKTVLVADDDMRNIFSLTKALEKYKMKVIAAVDGRDALTKLKSNPSVDIVLMDMMMPEMDGYESTAAIRRIPRYRDLPIIAVTAKAMMGDRAKCISAGASDYITKPIDTDQLFSLLRVWLYEKS